MQHYLRLSAWHPQHFRGYIHNAVDGTLPWLWHYLVKYYLVTIDVHFGQPELPDWIPHHCLHSYAATTR